MTLPAVWQEDPAAQLLKRCAVLAAGLPANPALTPELCWSVRERGDWLAAAIAPGFVRIFMLPGDGALWGDIPLGQQRYVTLGGVDWRFIAAHDPLLGNYQYVDLAPSIGDLPGMPAARLLAADARLALGLLPAPALAPAPAEPPKPVSRRGFLRALSGRR